MPEPHKVTAIDIGVSKWRPAVASLIVQQAGPERHIVLYDDGQECFRFRLDQAAAAHFAALLLQGWPLPAETETLGRRAHA